MLGRKGFTLNEVATAKTMVKDQLAALKKAKATGALETITCNSALLALDRFFVHRVRPVTGKDANPLNEVEALCESLMLHDGVFTTIKALKYSPETSVLGLKPGDRIALTAADFARIADAFFDDLEAKFL